MASSASHFLLVPVPVWSHTKALCALAVRIVTQTESTVVTIFTTSTLLEKCQLDISDEFDESQLSTRQRIRLLSIADSSGPTVTATLERIAQNYPATYETLVQCKPATCLTSGVVFDAAPPLSAVIMDSYCKPQLKATQAITGDSVPIVSWLVTGVPVFLRNFGPESLGGLGDKTEEIQDKATRTGQNVWVVGDEFYANCNGSIVDVPGVPTMYDYEFYPQKLHATRYLTPLIDFGRELLKASSSMLIASHGSYGKETTDALREWQSEQGKPVYLVGPTLFEPSKSTVDLEVASYLDRMLEQHGRAAVVYIAFGTASWPIVPEYVEEVIEALMEKDFPFILTLAGPHARLDSELEERIKASGNNFICQWAPQAFILDHPAAGWFISHCGHNSVTEALSSGVPLITWPFNGDQPQGAAYVVDKLKAGFELFEVRTGLGLQPSHRTGKAPKGTREAVGEEIRCVLDACRSEEGVQARQNALKMKTEFRAAWKEDGAARIALRDFLEKYDK